MTIVLISVGAAAIGVVLFWLLFIVLAVDAAAVLWLIFAPPWRRSLYR